MKQAALLVARNTEDLLFHCAANGFPPVSVLEIQHLESAVEQYRLVVHGFLDTADAAALMRVTIMGRETLVVRNSSMLLQSIKMQS